MLKLNFEGGSFAVDPEKQPLAFPINLPHAPKFNAQSLLDELDSFSRRIDVLARQLNCLGYFDDGGDYPRAA